MLPSGSIVDNPEAFDVYRDIQRVAVETHRDVEFEPCGNGDAIAGAAAKLTAPVAGSMPQPVGCGAAFRAIITLPATGMVMALVQNCAPEAYRFTSWNVVVTPSPVPMT